MSHDPNVTMLKAMVRGAYDLQLLRIQTGLRLVANFRAKLGLSPSPEETSQKETDEADTEAEEAKAKADKEAKKIIDRLRASYRRLTDGIAKNRTLPSQQGFKGDKLIGNYAELVLVAAYFRLEGEERTQFTQLELVLAKIPIYHSYLSTQHGIGPAMAGVLVSCLDPAKARHASAFWRYAGLDVGPDSKGRSRREAHLVERTYTDRHGEVKTRRGVTYDPWLKTKLVGVLAPSMLRLNSPWRTRYDDYRNRMNSDPARIKLTVAEWKKRRLDPDEAQLWPPGRIHRAAMRYMIKMFLLELWLRWRELEGLPVTPSYHEGKLGHHHERAA